MMDIKNPEYFIMLADRRNMSRAAEALGLSQPSLSYYLTRLEQDLGCALFLRKKGELELTAAGRLYLDAARRTIRIRNEVYEDIRRLDRENHLWVTAGEEWTQTLLGWVLPRFQERFPSVSLEVTFSAPQAEALLSCPAANTDTPDFCLGSALAPCGEVLSREPLYLALPEGHPLSGAGKVSADLLVKLFQKELFLAPSPDSCLARAQERIFKEQPPVRVCPAPTAALRNGMLASGKGAAILPREEAPALWLPIQPEIFLYRVLWQPTDAEPTPPRRLFAQLCREYFK